MDWMTAGEDRPIASDGGEVPAPAGGGDLDHLRRFILDMEASPLRALLPFDLLGPRRGGPDAGANSIRRSRGRSGALGSVRSSLFWAWSTESEALSAAPLSAV